MIADRLRQETWFKMATNGVIDLPLEATQVGRLGRNAAATGFVPRRDKLPRIRTSFDYDENLVHTQQYRPANHPPRPYRFETCRRGSGCVVLVVRSPEETLKTLCGVDLRTFEFCLSGQP